MVVKKPRTSKNVCKVRCYSKQKILFFEMIMYKSKFIGKKKKKKGVGHLGASIPVGLSSKNFNQTPVRRLESFNKEKKM